MVVCVEAGLGLDQAMRKVSDEMKRIYQSHFRRVRPFELSVAGRSSRGPTCLHELGVRTGVDDLRSLASILIQADKFGSSIAQALRVQSDSMRTRRRQLAEEKAAKTAVKLIFPLVIFIFPGIFVVLVGPAAITMVREMFPMMSGTGSRRDWQTGGERSGYVISDLDGPITWTRGRAVSRPMIGVRVPEDRCHLADHEEGPIDAMLAVRGCCFGAWLPVLVLAQGRDFDDGRGSRGFGSQSQTSSKRLVFRLSRFQAAIITGPTRLWRPIGRTRVSTLTWPRPMAGAFRIRMGDHHFVDNGTELDRGRTTEDCGDYQPDTA